MTSGLFNSRFSGFMIVNLNSKKVPTATKINVIASVTAWRTFFPRPVFDFISLG